ncbi:hypothetical protein NMS_2362 [Nonlabens marinus S1-08]|uniref:Uncharacterized protein n=1 Tax=Nonlabens marinus S1-08 TaxID=1454201 RepID=W8W0I2_9FLAO|nr:hypothetical protein NMS_2362 [Nonlabens marinus S1-08]
MGKFAFAKASSPQVLFTTQLIFLLIKSCVLFHFTIKAFIFATSNTRLCLNLINI